MEETEKKPTKHHGSSGRPHRIEVTLSDEENSRLQNLSTAAGVKPAQLIRELIMQKRIRAALKKDERKAITDISKIGTNIWQIRKEMIDFGIVEEAKKLEEMHNEFDKIKEYFKPLLRKKLQE